MQTLLSNSIYETVNKKLWQELDTYFPSNASVYMANTARIIN